MAVSTKENELLWAHMRRALQMLVIFEVEVGEPIEAVWLLAALLPAHLFIIILNIFYFLGLVVYLIVFDVQQ